MLATIINDICMIFSCSRKLELPRPLLISNFLIKLKSEAGFLGVIADENPNLKAHVRSKMARNLGRMYKLNSQLSIRVTIQIWHSFVRSHTSNWSLVLGFRLNRILNYYTVHCTGMRAKVTGLINYRYRIDGTLPGHTKAYFGKFNMLTVQSVIVFITVIFMHRVRHVSQALPQSVRLILTVAEISPL